MTSPLRPRHGLANYERAVLAILAAGATLLGAALLFARLRTLARGETTMSLLTRAEVPYRYEAHTDAGAGIMSAGFDSATVVAGGLSDGTRALLTGGVIADAVATAVSIGAVAWFLLLLIRNRPFHRSLVAASLAAGSALLIGGILSAGLGGLGRMQAAVELNPLAGGVFKVGFLVDPWPAVAGLGVLALAFVFRRGERLQRDTEGLV